MPYGMCKSIKTKKRQPCMYGPSVSRCPQVEEILSTGTGQVAFCRMRNNVRLGESCPRAAVYHTSSINVTPNLRKPQNIEMLMDESCFLTTH